jgi:hypothetical protein
MQAPDKHLGTMSQVVDRKLLGKHSSQAASGISPLYKEETQYLFHT